MKITVPHIHKIEGEAGFLAKVTKEGNVQELKVMVLEGLRQIEGILIGRRVEEVPLVVARICGICPVVHALNACVAAEKALGVKVSSSTVLLRKLLLASQIVQSHALHLFFLALPDFFDIENDLDLLKKFPKEAKAALKVRDFSLRITEIVGGRKVHPITPQIGGFSKLPEKEDFRKVLRDFPSVFSSAKTLAKTFQSLSYPDLKRKTSFTSLFSKKEYPFYQANIVLIKDEKSTIGNFYSNKIEEDFKIPPVKKVRYQGRPYMLGAIARVRNNANFLSPQAKKFFEEFKRKKDLSDQEFFENSYHNLFCQAVEVLHLLEVSRDLIGRILKSDLKEARKEFKIKKGSGLSAMEAPRGTLFTYLEIDNQGRVLNCNIVTPTAQFLANLEEDLKVLLPSLLKLPEKKQKRKIRSLIRAYDSCISCAVH